MTGPDQSVRLLVLGRDGWRCVRCRGGGGCEVHHRCPRRSGGTSNISINIPENLLTLCVNCHRWVESYRHAAIQTGYLLSTPERAPEVPVQASDGWTWFRFVADRRVFALAAEVKHWQDTGSLPEFKE